jgi:hypothetical protein
MESNITSQSVGESVFNETERNEAKHDAELESKVADLKQHADKLILGFVNIDSSSGNRAIWELVQNACDLSDKCKITINYSGGFSFTHNGKPFTSATLISLIKQVSNKDSADDVGKFGTGFITTHAFGRKFKLTSTLNVKEKILRIKDFLIDRTSRDWKGMVESLIDQEKQVYKLIETGQFADASETTTTFTYLPESKTELESINESLVSLHSYVPLVLTVNSRLSSVTVIEKDGTRNAYSKEHKVFENGYFKTTISTNGEPIEVFSLLNDQSDIEVILPFDKHNNAIAFKEHVAKLFLYFPLIGSEDFGFNFIIHSKRFLPTEPRDGIHLKSKTEQVQEDEVSNRKVISEASKMIFEFLLKEAKVITNPINLSRIAFNVIGEKPLLNEYFIELKQLWISQFKTFPLVETASGNLTPSEAHFFHNELLQDEKAFDAITALVSKFWTTTPKKHLIKEWTSISIEWNIADIKFVSIKDLASKIQDAHELSVVDQSENLKVFYQYLIEQGRGDLFGSYKLLPNIKGEFRQLANLNSNLNLPEVLIKIADVLMPDIPKRHVHAEFKFNLDFSTYGRKNFATEINESISKRFDEKALSSVLPGNYLAGLLDYCKVATTVDSSSVPSRIMKIVCRYYMHDETLIEVPDIKEDVLDVRPPQRKLLRLFLNDLASHNSQWVTENIIILKDTIATGYDYYEYEDMFKTLPIYPNQLDELAVQTSLSIDENIPDEIKKLYDTVVKPSVSIKSILVNGDFSPYIKNPEGMVVRDLTEKIESIFFGIEGNPNINDHPFKKEILDLIETMKSSEAYQRYFSLLFSKRSSILVDLADGEDTFSILSLDASRIKDLAALGNDPDFEQIVALGKKAVNDKHQEEGNFHHKWTIGTHIETVLRARLTALMSEVIEVEIKNEQDGQDIIIKVNREPKYFIEVKSRWDVNSSYRMSKNQTLKAYAQKDNYALCTVDMTQYHGDDRTKVKSLNHIEHLIRFNENIGEKVEHLIAVLEQTNEPDSIHLDGDYRTLIPISFVDKGIDIKTFEDSLVELLQNLVLSGQGSAA